MSSPHENADTLKKLVEGIIAQGKTNELQLAKQPFKSSPTDAERFGKLISRPKSTVKAKKELQLIPTGTFIDNLFLNESNQPASGIPIVVQLGIVGLPDVGKSILVQEIALRMASEGKRVVFVTSEDAWESSSPRFDLQSRMKQKADLMSLEWEDIRNNLFVFDTITHSELRDWHTFVEAYRYLVEILKGIDILIVDSITLMESYRGALKYRLMELARYNQLNGITAIYVCQRSEEKADSYGMAGGIALAHNLDATICVDIKKAVGQLKADLGKKQWEETHFVRVFGCRLCGFDRKYYEATISDNGFLSLLEREN